MSGAETHRRSPGVKLMLMHKFTGRGALLKRRSRFERSGGVLGRENAGMSSEMEVGILQAEYPRIPG